MSSSETSIAELVGDALEHELARDRVRRLRPQRLLELGAADAGQPAGRRPGRCRASRAGAGTR